MNKIKKEFSFLKPIKTNNLIRLGARFDGGYVVQRKIIKNIEEVITFGLGNDWSFELDLIKVGKKNLKIHIYDHTVSIKPYLKNVFKVSKRFLTFRTNFFDLKETYLNVLKYLSLKFNKNIILYYKKISGKVSKDKNEVNLKFALDQLNLKKSIFLKVDIEGSEYKVISDIIKYQSKIEMIIIEFHDIKKNIKKFKKKILQLKNFFFIGHIHGNNHSTVNIFNFPDVLELTFLKKKYLPKKIVYNLQFPRPKLDYPNNKYKDDLKFVF